MHEKVSVCACVCVFAVCVCVCLCVSVCVMDPPVMCVMDLFVMCVCVCGVCACLRGVWVCPCVRACVCDCGVCAHVATPHPLPPPIRVKDGSCDEQCQCSLVHDLRGHAGLAQRLRGGGGGV